jgi:subtilisin family serine protease
MKVQRIDTTLPVIFGSLSAGRIAALAASDAVSAVFLHEPKGVDDLGTSMAIANADDAQTAGFTGRGINVAVYEAGPDDNSDLQIAARFLTNPGTSDHSRHTHGIIKNIEPRRPHGHAPDCNLHSANSYDLDAIAWAADQGCTVISQSFHRDSEETSSGLSFDDIYKDQLALRWPYPTICEAAGNGADSEFVNHKGFNRLTVGNHNDSAGGMASDTVFRNPAASHGDRELPEIAANGTGVTAVGLTKGGTSMAAPAVAGGVALIQQANATLRSWPEGCRAIMMAAAWRNPAGSTWRADLVAGVDGVDGAGAIDSNAAVQIARARKSRNNTAARRGWDVGTMRSADIGGDGFASYVYRIAVPRLIFSPMIKVALAWDSKITTLNLFGLSLPIASTLTVDLDLQVRDSNGAVVASSASWDNSYEIAEFAAQAGHSYEIRIRRFSGSDDVWYGVAWQLRGTEFLIERLANVAHMELGPR